MFEIVAGTDKLFPVDSERVSIVEQNGTKYAFVKSALPDSFLRELDQRVPRLVFGTVGLIPGPFSDRFPLLNSFQQNSGQTVNVFQVMGQTSMGVVQLMAPRDEGWHHLFELVERARQWGESDGDYFIPKRILNEQLLQPSPFQPSTKLSTPTERSGLISDQDEASNSAEDTLLGLVAEQAAALSERMDEAVDRITKRLDETEHLFKT